MWIDDAQRVLLNDMLATLAAMNKSCEDIKVGLRRLSNSHSHMSSDLVVTIGEIIEEIAVSHGSQVKEEMPSDPEEAESSRTVSEINRCDSSSLKSVLINNNFDNEGTSLCSYMFSHDSIFSTLLLQSGHMMRAPQLFDKMLDRDVIGFYGICILHDDYWHFKLTTVMNSWCFDPGIHNIQVVNVRITNPCYEFIVVTEGVCLGLRLYNGDFGGVSELRIAEDSLGDSCVSNVSEGMHREVGTLPVMYEKLKFTESKSPKTSVVIALSPIKTSSNNLYSGSIQGCDSATVSTNHICLAIGVIKHDSFSWEPGPFILLFNIQNSRVLQEDLCSSSLFVREVVPKVVNTNTVGQGFTKLCRLPQDSYYKVSSVRGVFPYMMSLDLSQLLPALRNALLFTRCGAFSAVDICMIVNTQWLHNGPSFNENQVLSGVYFQEVTVEPGQSVVQLIAAIVDVGTLVVSTVVTMLHTFLLPEVCVCEVAVTPSHLPFLPQPFSNMWLWDASLTREQVNNFFVSQHGYVLFPRQMFIHYLKCWVVSSLNASIRSSLFRGSFKSDVLLWVSTNLRDFIMPLARMFLGSVVWVSQIANYMFMWVHTQFSTTFFKYQGGIQVMSSEYMDTGFRLPCNDVEGFVTNLRCYLPSASVCSKMEKVVVGNRQNWIINENLTLKAARLFCPCNGSSVPGFTAWDVPSSLSISSVAITSVRCDLRRLALLERGVSYCYYISKGPDFSILIGLIPWNSHENTQGRFPFYVTRGWYLKFFLWENVYSGLLGRNPPCLFPKKALNVVASQIEKGLFFLLHSYELLDDGVNGITSSNAYLQILMLVFIAVHQAAVFLNFLGTADKMRYALYVVWKEVLSTTITRFIEMHPGTPLHANRQTTRIELYHGVPLQVIDVYAIYPTYYGRIQVGISIVSAAGVDSLNTFVYDAYSGSSGDVYYCAYNIQNFFHNMMSIQNEQTDDVLSCARDTKSTNRGATLAEMDCLIAGRLERFKEEWVSTQMTLDAHDILLWLHGYVRIQVQFREGFSQLKELSSGIEGFSQLKELSSGIELVCMFIFLQGIHFENINAILPPELNVLLIVSGMLLVEHIHYDNLAEESLSCVEVIMGQNGHIIQATCIRHGSILQWVIKQQQSVRHAFSQGDMPIPWLLLVAKAKNWEARQLLLCPQCVLATYTVRRNPPYISQPNIRWSLQLTVDSLWMDTSVSKAQFPNFHHADMVKLNREGLSCM